jgi:hypothetical protein
MTLVDYTWRQTVTLYIFSFKFTPPKKEKKNVVFLFLLALKRIDSYRRKQIEAHEGLLLAPAPLPLLYSSGARSSG